MLDFIGFDNSSISAFWAPRTHVESLARATFPALGGKYAKIMKLHFLAKGEGYIKVNWIYLDSVRNN